MATALEVLWEGSGGSVRGRAEDLCTERPELLEAQVGYKHLMFQRASKFPDFCLVCQRTAVLGLG